MSHRVNMNNVTSVGVLIQKLLDSYRLRSKYNEVKLRHAWEKIMPKAIVTRTTQFYFREGTLYIKVISAPLREELMSMQSQLLEKLNEELGAEVLKNLRVN
jgi:hypothetical protein